VRGSIGSLERTGFLDWSARAQATASLATLGMGEVGQALADLVPVLRSAADRGSFIAFMEALPVAALLLLGEGNAERAIEVYELARTFPYVANSQWYEDVVGKPIAEAAGALPSEVVAAAKERGRSRDAWATVDELIAVFEATASNIGRLRIEPCPN
jgi:hypothetical protein